MNRALDIYHDKDGGTFVVNGGVLQMVNVKRIRYKKNNSYSLVNKPVIAVTLVNQGTANLLVDNALLVKGETERVESLSQGDVFNNELSWEFDDSDPLLTKDLCLIVFELSEYRDTGKNFIANKEDIRDF
jgi:hypothetical protein